MQATEKFFAASVIGESHIESGKPVQDYSLAVKGEDFCIAVVCDGHGGSKHFRSETGSRLAAESARNRLLDFQSAYPDWESVSNGLKEHTDRLKIAILSEWQNRIEEHEKSNKFTEEELKKVSSTFTARSAFDIASPYGTTLLLALVCKDYYLVLMLGDGAIVKFKPDGSGEIIEFEGKYAFDDQPHSATDSMCDPHCYNNMFTKCEKRTAGDGLLIALCSDGMSEAFTTDEKMFSVMKNYINFVAEEGIKKADNDIPPHLRKLSQLSMAKDDVSFAFATNELELYDERGKDNGKVAEKEEKPRCEEKTEASNAREVQSQENNEVKAQPQSKASEELPQGSDKIEVQPQPSGICEAQPKINSGDNGRLQAESGYDEAVSRLPKEESALRRETVIAADEAEMNEATERCYLSGNLKDKFEENSDGFYSSFDDNNKNFGYGDAGKEYASLIDENGELKENKNKDE